jgi:ATP-dependent DNA ligase
MDRLAEVCERVSSYGSRLKKIGLVADYLKTLSDEDLARAVSFLCCGPVVNVAANGTIFGADEPRTLSIGYATLREAYKAATGWDDWVLGRCHEEVGDTGETISLLLPGHTLNEAMSLVQAEALYTRLYLARKTAEKIAILQGALATHRPLAIKYFIKVITSNLRIGLQGKMVEEAVALATGATHKEVREANNRLGDLARVALAARHGELHTIEARLFHPMDFMLAKPLDSLDDLADPENYIVEHKYDGIRSQVHVADGRVLIYTRGMDEVTASYPEVATAMRGIVGSAVFDGELLAWRNGRAVAFTVLQQRLARKKVSAAMLAEIPVVFMAYDLLYRDGELLLERPIEQRRALLETAFEAQPEPLLVSPQYPALNIADVDRLFGEARSSANEGLVLKRRNSVYEPGRRSGTWYKVKRPYATLDVVITAAEQGNGRRATVLSDYTFAVRAGDRFLNVGKAYSGLTDEEIRELTRMLRASTLERYGRVLLVRPEIVLEVAFDGVQKSARHKSGYALRFPRIVRWRQDKTAEECDGLERVKELYEASLAAGMTQ